MDVWVSDGRAFNVMMASDVVRDRKSLELTDLNDDPRLGPVAEVFWSDIAKTFSFQTSRAVDLPLNILSKLIDTALLRLPPSPDAV